MAGTMSSFNVPCISSICGVSLLLFFSHSVMFDSLRSHGLQHARLPCPSLSLGVCSNSCPLSRWCYPTISSYVSPFSSCPQSLPASGSFLTSWLFASGDQRFGTSASASALPMNIQGWFPLRLSSWISLQSKGLCQRPFPLGIQSVNPKGNQSWIFIGRTDAEAETPILWPPDAKNTHWERPWCCKRLKAEREEGDRGWNDWMATLIQWTWTWSNSRI